ncbi:MAG: 2'-5' RNA ligase family protein, partial [Burkholderiaceae bacterium]
MPASALIVRVPEVEALVGGLRERFDASARLGVPAHITLVYPFVEAERIDAALLVHIRTALEGAAAFDFALTRAER